MDEIGCKWVALLRGVNVGGANKVPMAELRALGAELGWHGVRSYIASGNLVFEAGGTAAILAGALREGMLKKMGVDVPILVLPAEEIVAALAACPWDTKGNLVHVIWCWDEPQIDGTLRDELIAGDEELLVEGRRVWLHAPSGIGRSKLMGKIDKVVGVQHTARNLNTLRKLTEMVER